VKTKAAAKCLILAINSLLKIKFKWIQYQPSGPDAISSLLRRDIHPATSSQITLAGIDALIRPEQVVVLSEFLRSVPRSRLLCSNCSIYD